MTTPTQAQIEVAAKAICIAMGHEWPCPYERYSMKVAPVAVSKYWIEIAEHAAVALTAAAEVGERKQWGILPDCMMPDGAQPCEGYQELRDEMELQIAHTKAATIERCAQVVDQWPDELYLRRPIAAAIRAKNDKGKP